MTEPYLESLSGTIDKLDLSVGEDILIECRHFFSGAAVYANGKMCASLTPAGFGLKLPKEARERVRDAGEGTDLRYFENAPVKKEYLLLSQRILDNDESLKSLLLISIEFVTRNGQLS